MNRIRFHLLRRVPAAQPLAAKNKIAAETGPAELGRKSFPLPNGGDNLLFGCAPFREPFEGVRVQADLFDGSEVTRISQVKKRLELPVK